MSGPARAAADEEGLEHGVNKAALHPLRDAAHDAGREITLMRTGTADRKLATDNGRTGSNIKC